MENFVSVEPPDSATWLTTGEIPDRDLNRYILDRVGYKAVLMDAGIPDRDENDDNRIITIKAWALLNPAGEVVVFARPTEQEAWDYAPSPTDSPYGMTLLVDMAKTQDGAQTVLVIDVNETSVSIEDETASIYMKAEPNRFFRLCAEAWFTYMSLCAERLNNA